MLAGAQQILRDPFAWGVTSPSRAIASTYRDQSSIGTMPPAFLVDEFAIRPTTPTTVDFPEYKLNNIYGRPVEVRVKWNMDLFRDLIVGWTKHPDYALNLLTDYQMRLIAVDRGSVHNDNLVKYFKWQRIRQEVHSLNNGSRIDGLSIAREYVNSIRCNRGDWTDKYLSTHSEAHPAPGIAWGELYKLNLLDPLYKFSSQFLKIWQERFDEPGEWAADPRFIGSGARGRTPSNMSLRAYYNFILARSRRVSFQPGPSSLGAFDTHHDQVQRLQKLFDFFEQRWGTKIYCPKIHGGSVYLRIQESILSGQKVEQYDVSGMELITPSIISGSLNTRPLGIGTVTFRNGMIPELMSGVFVTSDFDMLAHLMVLDQLMIKAPKYIVILGDDGVIVDGVLAKSLVYERQLRDEAIHRVLGLSIGKLIHPVGLNITVDTADKRINVPTHTSFSKGDGWTIVKNQLDLDARIGVKDLFLGRIGDQDYGAVLKKHPDMGGYYSPTEWAKSMVMA